MMKNKPFLTNKHLTPYYTTNKLNNALLKLTSEPMKSMMPKKHSKPLMPKETELTKTYNPPKLV